MYPFPLPPSAFGRYPSGSELTRRYAYPLTIDGDAAYSALDPTLRPIGWTVLEMRAYATYVLSPVYIPRDTPEYDKEMERITEYHRPRRYGEVGYGLKNNSDDSDDDDDIDPRHYRFEGPVRHQSKATGERNAMLATKREEREQKVRDEVLRVWSVNRQMAITSAATNTAADGMQHTTAMTSSSITASPDTDELMYTMASHTLVTSSPTIERGD